MLPAVGTSGQVPRRSGFLQSGAQLDRPGRWLPQGRKYFSIKDLLYVLARSARWHAPHVITGFASQDCDELLQVATSAGTAVELLGKVYIATMNPALLADKGDSDTILHLSGHGRRCKNGITEMKSVVGYEALRLIKQLYPQFPLVGDKPVVLRVRNAAVHMALVDSQELRAGVIEMVKMVESLLGLLDLDREHFWGSAAMGAVDSLLDEAAREVTQIVAAKLGAARRVLAPFRLLLLTDHLSRNLKY
jgi:hypothetical protein